MRVHHRLANLARDSQGIIKIRTTGHERHTRKRSRRQTGLLFTSIP
jgi:hypothetical protein